MNEPKYPLTDIFVEDWCHWIQGASFLRFFMELKTQDMQSARLAVEPLHYNSPPPPPLNQSRILGELLVQIQTAQRDL